MIIIIVVLSLIVITVALRKYRDPSATFHKAETLLNSSSQKQTSRMVHRLLLWDRRFPFELRPMIWQLASGREGFVQYLWRENDVFELLKQYPVYKRIYMGYTTRIQKSDFARYLIVYHFGGYYFDHDVKKTKKSMSKILENYKDAGCVLFEELTWAHGEGEYTQNYRIRQNLPPHKRKEVALRVANYAFYAKPKQDFMRKVLEKCAQRASNEVLEPYDVLFTTGPDVVSTVVDENKGERSVVVIAKTEANCYFKHLTTHGWYQEIEG